MGVSNASSPPVFGKSVLAPSGWVMVTASPVVFNVTSVPSLRALLSLQAGHFGNPPCQASCSRTKPASQVWFGQLKSQD